MILSASENVKYDENSKFSWDDLNESNYVKGILLQLQTLMGSDFENYVFYVFSNHNSVRIPESLHHTSSKKKVLIYVSDELGSDPSMYSSNYFAIFKAYLGVGSFASNVFPFPLGCVNCVPSLKVKSVNQRKINLFFRGNLNMNRIDFYRSFSNFSFILPPKKLLRHKLYRQFLIWIQSDFKNYLSNSIIMFNRNFKSGYSYSEYGQILSESKIVLSPKGFYSTECFRLYEALRAGSIIISEKLPPVVFYADSPIIQIENWKDGLRMARELLNDTERMDLIQRKTIEWWETVCSERAVASYMQNKLELIKS